MSDDRSLASALPNSELARQLRIIAELVPFYSAPLIAAADRLYPAVVAPSPREEAPND